MIIKKFMIVFAVFFLSLHHSSEMHAGIKVMRSEIETMQELAKLSPDSFKSVDKNGNTHLHRKILAAENKFILDMAQNLDSAIFKIMDVHNKDGYTPLHLIVLQIINKNNYLSMAVLKKLIEKGLIVNAQARNLIQQQPSLTTILHMAANKGLDFLVSILLEKGADRGATNFLGYTPLHIAALYGRIKSLILLINDETKNLTDKNGRNALFMAAGAGRFDSLNELIKHKVDIDKQDIQNYTALHYVIQHDELLPALHILLENGANTRLKDDHGRTAEEYAKEFNKLEALAILKKHKNSQALHITINSKQSNINKIKRITELLQDGVDIEFKNTQGQTPLQSCLAADNARLVEFFRTQGAQDISIAAFTDVSQTSSTASSSGPVSNSSSFDDLSSLPAKTKEEIEELNRQLFEVLSDESKTEKQVLKKVEELIQEGAQINSVDQKDQMIMTPLLLMASRGFESVIDLLLMNGADIKASNALLDTVLHIVCESQRVTSIGLMRKLLKGYNGNSGADLEAANSDRYTPLLSLLVGNNPSLAKVKILVEEYYANINIKIEDKNIIEIVEDRINGLEMFDKSSERIDELYSIQEYFILKFKQQAQSSSSLPSINVEELNSQLFSVLWYGPKNEKQVYQKVRILLLKGAQVNINDGSQLLNTPLHCAAITGFKSVIKLLLDHKANINALNKIEMNPLLFVFLDDNFNPDLEYIKYLVETCGSRIDIIFENKNIIEFIKAKIKLLKERGKKRNIIDQLSSIKNYFEKILNGRALSMAASASSNSNIVIINTEMDIQLLEASQSGDLQKVINALQHGANINTRTKDENNFSALDLAAKYNHIDVIKELLKSMIFIDLNEESVCGNTLNLAVNRFMWKRDNFESIKLLFDSGLSVNTPNQSGKSAFNNAITWYLVEIVNLFLPKVDFTLEHHKNILDGLKLQISQYTQKINDGSLSDESKAAFKAKKQDLICVSLAIAKHQRNLK
ncbi:MAG: ankyrin repeat domain-containing protein [Candidatus Babeliales bacterium]|nr:ankyrin repeat domain-containing protein [Candidatus Babeliales bacterium]